MATLHGLDIIVHPGVNVRKTRHRTWRERLLTWPWKPWESCQDYTVAEDLLRDGQVLKLDGRLMMNRATYNRLLNELPQRSTIFPGPLRPGLDNWSRNEERPVQPE